jgi:hypothetical protein
MAEKYRCVMAGFDAETEAKLAELQNLLYENGFAGTQTKGIPFHLPLAEISADDVRDEEWLKEIKEATPYTEVNLSRMDWDIAVGG